MKKSAAASAAAQKKEEKPVAVVQEQLASSAAAKKKKKRRNKKKSVTAENGAGSDGSDDSDAEFTPKQVTAVKRPVNGAVVEDSSLGPHALLVNACVKHGFKPDEVHAAISYLFENNKDYDSVEAIMRHLRGEEDFEEAFVPSPITSFPNAAAPARAKTPVVEPLPREEEVAEEEEEEASSAVPLETRLEIAVSDENLEASLGALNQFIGLAKDQQEWAEQRKPLFGSRTLELLMTNLLTQSVARPSDYPAQLQAGLQKLLQHLLGTSSVLPELLEVIAHTQKLNARSALSASSMEKIGTAVADTIRDYSERLDSTAEGAIELPLLEARLTNTTCARVSKSAAPKELFALRESRVEAVGNYKKACGIMLGSLSSTLPPIAVQRKPNSESLLETLLKESLQVSSSGLKDKRAQIDRLRAEMSSVRSAMEIELQPLRVEVSGCKVQLEEKRNRRETILRELATLDREIGGIEARQERVENIINDRIASYENAHAKHDSRLKGMLSIMHRADEAEAIAQHVTAIGERLSTSEKQAGKSEDMQGKLLARLPGFVNALDAYLDVEVQCYDFLKSRSEKLATEVAQVSKQIAQFQASGLSMKDSVSAMSAQKATKQAHIEEDKAAMASLRDHAEGLYMTVRAALDRLKLLPLGVDPTALHRVKEGLNHMGLGRDWALTGLSMPDPVLLMPRTNGPASPLSMPTHGNGDEANKAPPAPIAARPPGLFSAPPAPVANTPMIKMSWASRVAGPNTTVVKSLTEIQAEELENLKRCAQSDEVEVAEEAHQPSDTTNGLVNTPALQMQE